MILMIDNYDSFTYNIVQYLQELNATLTIIRNDATTTEALPLDDVSGVIISPGPCSPKEAGISCDVIRKCYEMKIPLLGVCLGHQSIGDVFGGDVIHAPYLMHGKVSDVHHENIGVFKDLPSPFKATRYHSLTIDPKTFPEELEVTARTDDDIIMGLRHKTAPIQGVQFHPESILTEHGHQLFENFLNSL
jgi:anthranilate synthase component 2